MRSKITFNTLSCRADHSTFSYLKTVVSFTLAAPCDTRLSFHSFLHSFIPNPLFPRWSSAPSVGPAFLNNRVNDRIVSFPFGTYPTYPLRFIFFIYFSLDFPYNYLQFSLCLLFVCSSHLACLYQRLLNPVDAGDALLFVLSPSAFLVFALVLCL